MVEAVQDDPARRRELAAVFYDDRPQHASIRHYRHAELSFMDWQLRRGVLAPTGGVRPGSAWWRAVNGRLLSDSWEAHHLAAGEVGQASRPAVTRWIEFLERPTPQSWYRAHNASIASAYCEFRDLSEGELPVEKFFMDVTLARVLFVHGLVTKPRMALGRVFWPIGRALADPRSRSVDAYLSMRNVLPDMYPLTRISITQVLDGENFLGRLIDYGVMMPRAQELYEHAARDLAEPRLREFIKHGSPVYGWPYEDREAWQQRKHRRLGAAVARLTGA